MARKHHSIEFQDQACKLVTEQGYTQEKAARELGITAVTLRAWLKKRGLLEPVPAARFRSRREAEKARRRFTRGIELLDSQRALRRL